MRYVAKCKCQYNRVIYDKGEELRHVVGEVTEANPPQDYFQRLEAGVPITKEPPEDDPDTHRETLKGLRGELDSIKVPYDKRWGVAKLQETLINAKKGI